MNAWTCTRPGQLDRKTVDEPAATEGNVILRVRRIGVCGTDLHAYEGTQPYFNYPRILGHELAGEVVAGENKGEFPVGEMVTFIPYFHCSRCVACRAGRYNCCERLKVCGVHIDGGMVDYLSVPTYSLVHGNGLSLDELALVEPLSIGAHAVKRAALKPEEFVLVVGAGPIGLGTMAFARIAGARVIALDRIGNRLEFAKQKIGVQHTVIADANTLERVKDITGGDMPTVVMDATGNGKAIMEGFGFMAHGGRYVLVGLQKGDISFSHPEFHKREATLMSSRNALREDFDAVMTAMRSGLVRASDFISVKVSFDDLDGKFPQWVDPSRGVIKAMIENN